MTNIPSDDSDNLEAWQLELQLDAAMHERQYELVIPLAERLLEIQDAKLGPMHETTLKTVSRLTEGAIHLAQWSRAEELLERLRVVGEASAGKDIATESIPLFRQAAALHERSLGAKHPQHLKVLLNLATALVRQGQVEEAEMQMRRALGIARELHGPEHSVVATCHSMLADLAKRRKDWDSALPHAVEAFKIRSANLTREPEHLYHDLMLVGEIFSEVGEYEEACKSFRLAFELAGGALDSNPLKMARALLHFGRAAMLDKKPENAIRPLEGAVEFFEKAYGETDVRLIDSIYELGKAYQDADYFEEAEETFLKLRRLYQACFPEKSSEQAVPLGALGDLAHQRKDYARAAAYLEEAVAFGVAEFGEESVRLHVLLDKAAESRLAEGNLERAKELSQWQIRIMMPHLPNEDDPALLAPVRRLADVEIRRLKDERPNEEELPRLLQWVKRLLEAATKEVQAETAEIKAQKARKSGAS